MTGISCEKCTHYKMIDSGYGHCIAMPPTECPRRTLWERIRRVWPEHGLYDEYLIVAWTTPICGLFIRRESKKEKL